MNEYCTVSEPQVGRGRQRPQRWPAAPPLQGWKVAAAPSEKATDHPAVHQWRTVHSAFPGKRKV